MQSIYGALLALLLAAPLTAYAQDAAGDAGTLEEETPEPASAAPAAAAPATPAPATPAPAAAVTVSVAASTEHGAGGDVEAATGAAADAAERRRVQNSWYGPSGGIHVVDAGSGAPQSVRLQLAVDMFSSSDFLIAGDTNDYFGGTLTLGVTAIEHLELFAALHSHANANSHEEPRLLQVLGDAHIGAKAYGAVLPWLTLGGDLRLVFLNSIGDVGPVLKGTSIGLRGAVSADFRALEENPLPLIARFSLDYFFDNSSLLVDSVEDTRYEALGPTRNSRDAEERHLIRRVERFALGIQRMDMLTVGLGAEIPLRVHEAGWFLHPITELAIGIPVNRQGYSCLLTSIDTGPADGDGCLDIEGLAAMPATWTLGARVFTPVVPLSFLLGFDIGLSGTSTFVRELAANRPWALLLALSYGLDEREQTKEVVKTRELVITKAPPELPRIQGVVVSNATGAGIEGAVVKYVDRADLNGQVTDAAGGWVSYPFAAGVVRVEASHAAFEPRICAVTVPALGAAGATTATSTSTSTSTSTGASARASAGTGPQLNPYLYKSSNAAFAASDAEEEGRSVPSASGTTAEPGARIALRCELTPKVKTGSLRGIVVNEAAAGVIGAQLVITGVATQLLTTDGNGNFVIPQLPAGAYSVRVEAEGYLLKVVNVEVLPDGEASVHIELVTKPKEAQVELTKQEVRIRTQVFFRTNSADISEKSSLLLSEIADVMLRNPQVTMVEVQGHTDNQGNPQHNLQLSQARAEAVRTALVAAGVEESRLEAKGYGDTRPLAPNITERARARNRRVQLVIKTQQ